jgi:phosphatidylinositol 4-kinase B
LICSFISNLCHLILYLHVRSTAPATADILQKRQQRAREKVLFYYYVKEQREEANEKNSTHSERAALLLKNNGTGRNGNTNNSKKNLLPNHETFFPPLTRRSSENSDNSIHRMQRMTNEFMLEIQAQLQKTKSEWTKRLDDYRARSAHLGSGGGGGSSSTSGQELLHRPFLTPFRVLLQLFAYEDVLTNHRLDAVYDQDDGVALMFFIPQLLSFLLHGAYDSSPQLEEWILDTCRRNVYFAHRCYWFVRAWCLESTHDAALDQSTRRLSRCSSFENGYLLEKEANGEDITNSIQTGNNHDKTLQRLHLSTGSLSSLNNSYHNNNTAILNHNNGNGTQSPRPHCPTTHKLTPEERAVLEGLMVRIVECAEDTARLLHFGTGREWDGSNTPVAARLHSYYHHHPVQDHPHDTNDRHHHQHDGAMTDWDASSNCSPSALMQATEAGAIPVDPQTGIPSAKHWDCVAAGDRKFGFLPLDRALTNSATSTTNTPLKQQPLLQPLRNKPPSQQTLLHNSLLQKKDEGPSFLERSSSYFDSTPVFFDALLTIAENLFKIPREQRVESFHLQLRSLEVQMLPSNSIYVPVQKNFNHRVWRIVADESIAISTKERVPCIICLEVVDFPRGEVPATRDVRSLLERAVSATSSGGGPLSNGGGGGGASISTTNGTGGSPNGGWESQSQQNLTTVGVANGPLSTFRYSAALNEKELVHQWRYGYRDPHRQDTTLEKLAYTMRDGIRRIPLNQMKSQMKAQMDKFNLHDLLTIHMPDTFSSDDDASNHSGGGRGYEGISSLASTGNNTAKKRISRDGYGNSKMESLQVNDMERGTQPRRDLLSVENQDVNATPPVSGSNIVLAQQAQPQRLSTSGQPTPTPPRSPQQPRTTMGQWTSPHHVDGRPSASFHTEDDDIVEGLVIPPTRDRLGGARLDYASATTSSTITEDALHRPVYGSNGPRRTNSLTSSRTPNVPQTISGRKETGAPPKARMKPPPVVFKENWRQKEERLRSSSVYGSHLGWRLLPLLIKANDDLRQEQLASQLIYRMSLILARENVPVWLCPYEILATTDRGGIIEAIPDTISIASLKKNDPSCPNLKDFFVSYFVEVDELADAKANFCESLAAYSMVCFFLQIKDRHNGNILLDNRGHLIHIDFGFFFLSSPGKNTGFESAPFKLTRDFVDLLDGPDSRLFRSFRVLCYRTFIALRRHCMEIILLVEMLKKGNEDLPCFRGRPDDAIQELRQRFRLDLNDRACIEYVNALVDESLENWRTNWYDRYQRYCVGIL